jgi:uracil-DNA glycosylase
VLRALDDLGARELFLDRLTAEEALGLVAGAPARGAPAAGPGATGAAIPLPTATGPLAAQAAAAASCRRCRLAESRSRAVFGRGSLEAELVVVGEGPGAEEDRTGLPFVGPAGRLLDLLLLAVGFERDHVYICNVVKCRPPNNRDPMADEVAACSPYLHAQLETIQPRAILAVGRFSGQVLTGSEASIGQLRGAVHSFRGIPVVATYHPAYLLRTPQATRRTWQDLQLVRQVLDEAS